MAIDEIGFGISAGGNQSDVFRDWRVCRAGPLTVDDFMIVIRIFGVGRSHSHGQETSAKFDNFLGGASYSQAAAIDSRIAPT